MRVLKHIGVCWTCLRVDCRCACGHLPVRVRCLKQAMCDLLNFRAPTQLCSLGKVRMHLRKAREKARRHPACRSLVAVALADDWFVLQQPCCVVQLVPLARLHFLVSIFPESLLAAVFALVRAPTRPGTGYAVACSMVEGKGFACCRAAGSASCRPERAGPYQSPPVACRSGCMWRSFGP